MNEYIKVIKAFWDCNSERSEFLVFSLFPTFVFNCVRMFVGYLLCLAICMLVFSLFSCLWGVTGNRVLETLLN